MKKKGLFVATYGDFFVSFLLDKMEILQNLGYEIICAANFEAKQYNKKTDELKARKIGICHIPFERSPFSFNNFTAYKRLKKLIQKEKIYLIDCHNPVAGALARLAASKAKTPFVIYTAHGFFFYDGAGWKGKYIYKPIEKYLSKKTDILITMSKEDYLAAQKMSARKEVKLVPGMGIDTKKMSALFVDRDKKRAEFGLKNEFTVVCVGECIPRKNQKTALKAFASPILEKARLLIVGEGMDLPDLERQAKRLHIENRVIFLGYRKDVLEILKSADVFLFPSYQEGLSIALLEAMAVGLPIVCSDIRGNRDCVEPLKGGFLFPPDDGDGFARGLSALEGDIALRRKMGEFNRKKASEFSKERVKKEYEKIYSSIENGE